MKYFGKLISILRKISKYYVETYCIRQESNKLPKFHFAIAVFVNVIDQSFSFLFGNVDTYRTHDGADFLGRYMAIFILIKQSERLSVSRDM